MVVGQLTNHLGGAVSGIIINEQDLQIAETRKRQQLSDDRRVDRALCANIQ